MTNVVGIIGMVRGLSPVAKAAVAATTLLAVVLATFVSEDLTCVAVGLLLASGRVSPVRGYSALPLAVRNGTYAVPGCRAGHTTRAYLLDPVARVGVLSAGLRVKQAEKLVRLGVLPWIDPGAIFFTDQLGVSKPNPKLYVKACEALKVAPARVLYVGDRPASRRSPAHAAGLKTVHYRGAHGRYSETPASPPADHEVELLTDLKPILRTVYHLPV